MKAEAGQAWAPLRWENELSLLVLYGTRPSPLFRMETASASGGMLAAPRSRRAVQGAQTGEKAGPRVGVGACLGPAAFDASACPLVGQEQCAVSLRQPWPQKAGSCWRPSSSAQLSWLDHQMHVEEVPGQGPGTRKGALGLFPHLAHTWGLKTAGSQG